MKRNTLLFSSYHVERKWSCTSWAYVPEHDELTLAQARALVKKDKHYEREGMRQRIVRTTDRIVSESRSRKASCATLDAISNIRGW